MSNDLKSLLKQFREEKRISQNELADMLNCSRAIVSSWEDGSAIPPRTSIITIGRELKLNPDDIDKLLELAGYEKLSGAEVVGLVTTNVLSLGITKGDREYVFNDLTRFFNSTGTYMGGTINSLGEKVQSIEHTLGQIGASTLAFNSTQNAQFAQEIEKRITPIVEEVKSIREEIVPQLETTKNQLSKSDEFLRRSAEFFISAVEGEGAIKIVGNQIESIDKRLDKVESQLNISKERTIAIVSVVIAVISVCITLASLAVLLYTTFGR